MSYVDGRRQDSKGKQAWLALSSFFTDVYYNIYICKSIDSSKQNIEDDPPPTQVFYLE